MNQNYESDVVILYVRYCMILQNITELKWVFFVFSGVGFIGRNLVEYLVSKDCTSKVSRRTNQLLYISRLK